MPFDFDVKVTTQLIMIVSSKRKRCGYKMKFTRWEEISYSFVISKFSFIGFIFFLLILVGGKSKSQRRKGEEGEF